MNAQLEPGAVMKEINSLVDEFSVSLRSGHGSLFVGSGISVPSGLPTWDCLLQEEAEKIGLRINLDDDLPAVAQYIVNAYNGNRGPLIDAIRLKISNCRKTNRYHDAISRSKIGTIWTTNYDTLIERASEKIDFVVSANDTDVSKRPSAASLEIVKMHGCIDRSPDGDLVITKEDYENFSIDRPAITNRLRNDILKNSFLFIGYGFGDRNIESILVEARRLSRRSTRRHYLIQKKVKSSTPTERQVRVRQKLWADDLRRIGIDCVFIDDFDILEGALNRLSLLSRGPTIFVTGTHENDSDLASEIGQRLATKGASEIVVLDGQSAGSSRCFISAFSEECVLNGSDLRQRLRFYPNPYAVNPAYSNNPALLPELSKLRSSLLRDAQIVIAFDGGMGTELEIEIAISLGCFVIPIPLEKSGLASRLMQDNAIRPHLVRHGNRYLKGWEEEGLVSPEMVVDCVESMLSEPVGKA